jgi:hypothetical protein
MNTDNMSILGLTIDYGPYGWIDDYDPDWTPNTTDAQGRRYRFANQPGICRWNLAHFGRALRPLVQDDDALAAGLELYRDTFDATFRRMQRGKLGLGDDGGAAPARRAEDDALVAELHQLLAAHDTDPTRWYRRLGALAEAPALPAAGAAAGGGGRHLLSTARPRPRPRGGRLAGALVAAPGRGARAGVGAASGDGRDQPGLHPPQLPRARGHRPGRDRRPRRHRRAAGGGAGAVP